MQLKNEIKIRSTLLVFASMCTTVILLSACGHSKGGIRPESSVATTRGEGGLLGVQGSRSSYSVPTINKGGMDLNAAVLGVQLKNKNFDIPVVYNHEVEHWVEYFTGQGKEYFSIYLERMNEYMPVILPKLKAAGLPQDLIYLAMIESGFSTQAKSRAGAMGQWQFMKSTGRLYGLKSNWWVEERRDPAKSADAAIAYLTRLHDEFGSWELAAAAYNSGEGRIRRAISRLHTKDFWEIARNRRALRRETRDYVPKMIAAAILAKNPEQFGFRAVSGESRWANTSVISIPKVESLRNLAKAANMDLGELSSLNPELMHCCTPPKVGPYALRVPKGEPAARLVAALESGEIGRNPSFDRYIIRKGETLSRIAASRHVPVEVILSINELRNGARLKPGTELLIPEGVAATKSREIASSEGRAPAGRKHMLYVVRKGDTLAAISRRYSVHIEEIRTWNSLRRSKILRPGSRLKLYVGNDQTKENI